MTKAIDIRVRFPNYQPLEGKENGRGLGKGYSRKRKYNCQALEGKKRMEETMAKAINIRERFPNYQPLGD
jgi:hypothetical protein